jgi:sec-independent protein translocase protein TatC
MKALRPIGHNDRLSIVDHLDELRSRMFVCAGVLLVAFCVCFWQNTHLLSLLNSALPHDANSALTNTSQQNRTIEQFGSSLGSGFSKLETQLAQSKGVAPGAVATVGAMAHESSTFAQKLKREISREKTKPLTIGVGESFTATLTVAAYFALLVSLPLILYQLYAFVLPAMTPKEKRTALPAMIAAPVLFAGGVVFTYFEILPPAIHFLQGYNSKQYYVLVQAGSYYKFEVLLMAGIGLAFQVPLFLLALQRVGIVSASMLTGNWRYAIVLIAVIAAALPGVDPVTMFFETLPLVVLYVASIVLLRFVEYRDAKRAAAEYARERIPGQPGGSDVS